VEDNGFNPVWDSPAEYTQFNITNPDVQLLSFEVWDEDKLSKNDFIGSFVVPVKLVRALFIAFAATFFYFIHVLFMPFSPLSSSAAVALRLPARPTIRPKRI
jgi:hypothetical protein